MSEKQLSELNDKLDMLVRLAARYVSSSVESKTDKIVMLGQSGLDRNLIAEICDSSPNAVSVTLSAAKRRAKGKK